MIEPAAVVILPIVGLAALRRRWTFFLLLVSVPFFTLEVATFASHPFSFPEIAMLLFIAQEVRVWIRDGQMRLPNGSPLILLWAFGAVAALSVVALVIRGSAAAVHPYDVPFQVQTLVPLKLSWKNLSQLALRAFFVVCITALALYLDRDRLKIAVRALVYGAVLTAGVGTLYQVAISVGWTAPIELLGEFGFRRFDPTPGSIGPLPRMYSLPGEPGFTSNHLLFGFALVGTLSVIPGPDWAFRARERVVLAIVLGVGLLATGGTTGYGGLVIFLAALTTLFALVPKMRSVRVRHYLAVAVQCVALGVIVVALVLGQTFVEVVGFQLQKMTFQAGSGSIRLYYVRSAIDVFAHHPILGAGVGSHATPSYLFTLLAETGILGATTLTLAHLWPYRQCVGILETVEPPVRRAAAALAVAGTTLFFTNLIAKSISSLILPWYWFGLALPIAIVAHTNWLEGATVKSGRDDDANPGGAVT